ncbi:MAG TPA: SRPBCC family protein [Acidimicrobiales bacterium]|jgi:hypothetical protein|nr:SRPBCC family protein [Acidimicrobiales bacterium]
MASIHHASSVRVPAAVAWDFLDRYTRSEVHVFSACVSERQEGDWRVVTLGDGSEVRERNVTVDAERMRAVYTVPGLLGAEHHQAEMRVVRHDDGGATLVWSTDILPDELADVLREPYGAMFGELVDAVNRHAGPQA